MASKRIDDLKKELFELNAKLPTVKESIKNTERVTISYYKYNIEQKDIKITLPPRYYKREFNNMIRMHYFKTLNGDVIRQHSTTAANVEVKLEMLKDGQWTVDNYYYVTTSGRYDNTIGRFFINYKKDEDDNILHNFYYGNTSLSASLVNGGLQITNNLSLTNGNEIDITVVYNEGGNETLTFKYNSDNNILLLKE